MLDVATGAPRPLAGLAVQAQAIRRALRSQDNLPAAEYARAADNSRRLGPRSLARAFIEHLEASHALRAFTKCLRMICLHAWNQRG